MTNGLPATIKEWREQHSEMAIIKMPLQMLEKLYEYSNASWMYSSLVLRCGF
jgi:hypothetical protein